MKKPLSMIHTVTHIYSGPDGNRKLASVPIYISAESIDRVREVLLCVTAPHKKTVLCITRQVPIAHTPENN